MCYPLTLGVSSIDIGNGVLVRPPFDGNQTGGLKLAQGVPLHFSADANLTERLGGHHDRGRLLSPALIDDPDPDHHPLTTGCDRGAAGEVQRNSSVRSRFLKPGRCCGVELGEALFRPIVHLRHQPAGGLMLGKQLRDTVPDRRAPFVTIPVRMPDNNVIRAQLVGAGPIAVEHDAGRPAHDLPHQCDVSFNSIDRRLNQHGVMDWCNDCNAVPRDAILILPGFALA